MESGSVNEDSVVNAAIKEGLAEIIRNHPRFRNQEDYLIRHFDTKRIKESLKESKDYINLRQNTEGKEWSDEKKAQVIYTHLSSDAASGKLFDEAGKESILRKSLEERTRHGPRRKEAREMLGGEKYLEQVTTAFKDIYSLFKTGDYSQHMPELAKAVSTVYNMGFLNSAVDILKHYNLLDKNRYQILKKKIIKKTHEGAEEAAEAMNNYSELKKMAAVVFGIGGAGVLFGSGAKITGNFLGGFGEGSVFSFIGIAMIIFAVFLWINGGKR